MLLFHLNIGISGFSLPKLESVRPRMALVSCSGVPATPFRQEGHACFRTPQTSCHPVLIDVIFCLTVVSIYIFTLIKQCKLLSIECLTVTLRIQLCVPQLSIH